MNFLLDTNVVSEWVRQRPNASVVAWLARVDEDRVFLSVVTFAELRHGIELMPSGRRRDRLAAWLAEELPTRFEGRVLGIDRRVAEAWGVMMGRGQKAGSPIGTMDAFFAATAEVHRLMLVTRDIRGFTTTGIPVFNPWDGP